MFEIADIVALARVAVTSWEMSTQPFNYNVLSLLVFGSCTTMDAKYSSRTLYIFGSLYTHLLFEFLSLAESLVCQYLSYFPFPTPTLGSTAR